MIATLRLALVALVVTATAGAARADDLVWGTSYQNPWSSWDAYSYKRVEYKARDTLAGTHDADAAADAGAPVEHRALSASDYKPVVKGHPALEQYLAARELPTDVQDQLRTLVDATIEQIEAEAIRPHNVATAMGVLAITAAYVVNGVELDDAAQDELIANLNDVLAADRRFKKLKHKDRQLLADTMMVQAALIMIANARGQTDADARETAQASARAALQFLTGSETAAP